MLRVSRAALVLLLSFSSLAAATPQGGEPDPQRTIERFQSYLARKPFHETGFEKMVEAAIVANRLEALVDEYRERSTGDSPIVADRVVLARLYAKTERTDEALALLDELGEESSELHQLRGTLLLRERRVEEAVAALEAAGASTEDRQRLEEIHALRGAAWAEAGEREKAVAAWNDLVALDPADFHLRAEAAAELAERGMPEAALVQYEAAVELAGEDAPRLCRALSELGRLHERLGRNEEALAAYARAREQLARGHWLRRDLEVRTLALHVRAGTLPDFARELEAAVAESPRELRLRELHARALVELRELEAARAVLAAATTDFPGDLALAREHLDVLELLGDADGRVREYQRILEHHQDDLELYLELGQVLASDGRLEQARRQWEKTLEGRLTDVGTCLRLAALHALFDMHEEALGLVERAIELEPQEIGHYSELAELYVRSGRPEAVAGVLDRAEQAAGDEPARLETAASLARGYRDLERAAALLERARAAKPDDTRLARELADVALELRDPERAAELLRDVATSASDPAHRRDAANRLARLARRSGDLRELERAERMRLREEPADADALYLAAVFALERGQTSRARKYLVPLVELAPNDDTARAMLAEALLDADDDAGAIAQFEALLELQPNQRARWLKEIARIHAKERRRNEAAECYEEVLRLSPGNPAAFREVAEAYRDMKREDEAVECLVQATRLAPDDGDLRLMLAELYEETDQPEKAEREVLRAVQSEDEGVRDRARAALYERLVADSKVDEEIARLRAAVADNPYDSEKPSALVDLFRRELEYALALDLLDELVRYRPRDPELLRERAGLLVELERFEDARADYSALLAMPEVDREDVSYDLAAVLLELGEREEAEKLVVQTGDLMRAANLYHKSGLRPEAVELLEKALGRTPDDRRLLRRLVTLKLDARDLDGALEVQERLVALEGETFEHLKGRARLLHAKGEREAFYACCQAMLDEVGPVAVPDADELDERQRRRATRRARAKVSQRFGEVRQLLYQMNLYDGPELVAERAMQADPANPVFVQIGLDALMTASRHVDAMTALEEVRAATLEAGVTPAGYDGPEDWARYLDRRESSIVKASPELAAQRAAELGAAPAELSREEVEELIELYEQQERYEELGELLVDAIERFPGEDEYLAALAFARLQTGELEAAERALRALLGEAPRAPRGLDVPKASRTYVKRLKRKLPEELVEQLDDATLARRAMLDENCPYRDRFKLGSRPKEDDVRLQLARCLAAQEREDEARAILREMEPAERDLVETRAFLAAIHRELDFEEDAQRLRDSVYEVVCEVGEEPPLRHDRRWPAEVVAVVREVTAELARGGEHQQAWELRRRWEGASAANGLLRLPEARATVTERCRANWEAALAAASGAEVPGSDALRNAGILYAELLVDSSDWEGAAAIYGELARRAPADLRLAALHARAVERAGRLEEAHALYVAAAEGARERVRAAKKAPALSTVQVGVGGVFDPYMLEPTDIPPARVDPSNVISELQQAGRFGNATPSPEDWVPWDLYCDLFRLELDSGEYAQAAQRLEAMGRVSNQVPSYIQWELREALTNRRAGKDAIGLWKLLYDTSSGDGQLVESYGEALVELDRPEEALRVYRKFVRDTNPGVYRRDVIERALAKLEPEAEEAARSSTPELVAAVEGDPKNVRLRSALVQRLLDESRYEEAAEHAQEAARLAPHLDDVRRLAGESLALAGRDAEYERFLDEELGRLVDPEARFATALRLAQLIEARGEQQAAFELLDATVRDGAVSRAGQYTAARFLIDHGDVDAGLAQLEREIEAQAGSGQWQLDRLEGVRARLAMALGDPLPELERVWKEYAQGGNALDGQRLDALIAAGATASDHEQAAQAIEAAAAELDPARANAYRAVAASLRGGEQELERVLFELALSTENSPSADTARALGLRAVAGAREREEWELAEERLARLTERFPARARTKVFCGIGQVSEATTLAAELGGLRLLRGDRAGAFATWEAALAGERDAPLVLARLCADHGLYDEARAALDEWTAGGKTLEGDDLLLPAAIAHAAGDVRATLDALEDAHLSQSAEPHIDMNKLLAEMERCHRALGSLAAHRDRLAAAAAASPDDPYLAARLVALTEELDGVAAADALVDRWGEAARQPLVELYLELSRRARLRGDLARAVELFERADRGDTREWSRSNRSRELTRMYVELGRSDEASETHRARFDDPDSAAAWVSWASTLRNLSADELALAAMERASELDDDEDEDEHALRSALINWIALEREEQALALVLERVADPELKVKLEGTPGLQELLFERDVTSQVEAALEAAPDDPAALARAAFVDYVLERYESAAERFERLLALDPRHHMASALSWKALRAAGRYEEALAALERELDREDRLQVREAPGSGQSALVSLREARLRLALRVGGLEAARAKAADALGRRFGLPQLWQHSPWNMSSGVAPPEAGWLYGLGDDAGYLERTRARDALEPEQARSDARRWRARVATEDEEAVLEELFATCASERASEALVELLIRLHRERGTFATFAARAHAAFSATPESGPLRALDWSVLRAEGRHAEALAVLRDSLDGRAPSASVRDQLARAAHAAGLHAEAYELARPAGGVEALAALVALGGPQLDPPRWFERSARDAEVRFAYGTNESPRGMSGGMSGGMVVSGSAVYLSSSLQTIQGYTSDQQEERDLAFLCALACLAGSEEAALIEAARRAELVDGWGLRAGLPLGRDLLKHGALDDAERVLRAHAEAWPDDHSRVLAELADAHLGRDDRAHREALLREWIAAFDVSGPKETPARLWARINRLVRHELELELVRADLARLSELDPRGLFQPAALQRAWLHLALGRPRPALALFREQLEENRLEGRLRNPQSGLLYGLGFALAEVEGPDAARDTLHRALAAEPDSYRAARARELLGEG